MNQLRVLDDKAAPINPPSTPINPMMMMATTTSSGAVVKPSVHSDQTKIIEYTRSVPTKVTAIPSLIFEARNPAIQPATRGASTFRTKNRPKFKSTTTKVMRMNLIMGASRKELDLLSILLLDFRLLVLL